MSSRKPAGSLTNQPVVALSLRTPAPGRSCASQPLSLLPCFPGLPALGGVPQGLRRAGLGTLVLVCQPPLPFLQEVFQDSPIPFCLIRTCSAGDVAGSHVLPCGSEQSALPRENSVFVRPNQRGAVTSPPRCFCLSCSLTQASCPDSPAPRPLSMPVGRPRPPRQALCPLPGSVLSPWWG